MAINYLDITLKVVAVSVVVGLVRSLNLYNTAHAVLALNLGLGLYLVGDGVRRGIFRPKWGLGSFLFVGVFGLALGLGLYHGYPLRHVLADAYRPLFFFLVYLLFRQAPPAWVDAQIIRRSTVNLLGVAILGVFAVFFIASRYLSNLYPSLTDVRYVFPLAAFWVSGARFRALGLVFALFVGGRRGALMGFLGALVLTAWARWRPLAWMVALPVGAAALFYLVQYDNPVSRGFLRLGTVEKSVMFYKIATREHGDDFALMVERMFDDRFAEIHSALRDVGRSPTGILLGRGFGFQYPMRNPYRPEWDSEIVRGVHFSPIAVFAHLGLVGLLFVYGFFARIAWHALAILRRNSNDPPAVFAFFFLAYLFDTFTGFSLFISPLFALCCGLVVHHAQRHS